MTAATPASPAATIEQLKAVRKHYWMINVPEAIDRLKALLGRTDLTRLYQKYFPKAYKASKKSLRAKSPDGHSPREEEFFELVRKYLFPIVDLCLDDNERVDYIPLDTAALDTEGMEAWKTAWLVIFGLEQEMLAEIDWNSVMEALPPGSELPGFVEDRQPAKLNVKRFFRAAARHDPHLRGLTVAFAMASFSTGNVFLDTTYDMMSYSEMPIWEDDAIDYFTKEWRAGERLLKRALEAVDWLEVDPARLADLIQMYNRCRVTEEAEKKAAAKQKASQKRKRPAKNAPSRASARPAEKGKHESGTKGARRRPARRRRQH